MSKKKSKKNKKVIIIPVIVGIVLISIGLIYILINNIEIGMNIKDRVNRVNKLVTSGASLEELNKVIKSDKLDSRSLLTGKDTYMRLKPSEENIKKYKLEKYEKAQDELATKLEKIIVEELDVQINGEKDKRKEGYAIVYSGVVKSFYLNQYIQDLKALEENLCTRYVTDDNNNEIEHYKYKVIAMSLLNKYIDNYKNEDEYSGFNVYVYDDDSKTADSIVSYLNMLQGINYKSEKVKKLETTRYERIDKYMEENLDIIKNFQ